MGIEKYAFHGFLIHRSLGLGSFVSMRAYKVWKPIGDREIRIPRLLDTSILGSWIVGARRGQAKPDRARQRQAEPGRARQSQAEPGRARQSQTEPGKARQSQTEPGRARQSHYFSRTIEKNKSAPHASLPDLPAMIRRSPDPRIQGLGFRV